MLAVIFRDSCPSPYLPGYILESPVDAWNPTGIVTNSIYTYFSYMYKFMMRFNL